MLKHYNLNRFPPLASAQPPEEPGSWERRKGKTAPNWSELLWSDLNWSKRSWNGLKRAEIAWNDLKCAEQTRKFLKYKER